MNKYLKFTIEYYRIFGDPRTIYDFIQENDDINVYINARIYETFCRRKMIQEQDDNFRTPDDYLCMKNSCSSCQSNRKSCCYRRYHPKIIELYNQIAIHNNRDLPFELFEKLPTVIEFENFCNSIEDLYKDLESYFESQNEILEAYYEELI